MDDDESRLMNSRKMEVFSKVFGLQIFSKKVAAIIVDIPVNQEIWVSDWICQYMDELTKEKLETYRGCDMKQPYFPEKLQREFIEHTRDIHRISSGRLDSLRFFLGALYFIPYRAIRLTQKAARHHSSHSRK